MKRKIAAFILSAMIALSALGGCAPAETLGREPITFTEEELSRETKLVPNPDLTGKLTVRYQNLVTEDPYFCYNVVTDLYREYFPNVDLKIEAVDFNDMPQQQFQTQLAAELMAGSGPDVFFLNFEAYAECHIHPNKMMQAGAFLDLTDYFRNDPNCNFSDFNQVVLDSGRYKGGLYLIPVYYQFPMLFTTQTIADKVGFHPENCVDLESTWKELLPILQNNPMDLPEQSKIFSLFTPFDAPLYMGISWIDYETQEVHLDDPILKKYCTFIRESLSPYLHYVENDMIVKGGSSFYTVLENQSVSLVDVNYCCTDSIFNYNLPYLYLDGTDDVIFLPWRTVDGGIEAYVRESMGVKQNTKNPEAAYQFIRTWLSEEFYASRDTWGQAYYNSVNNRAMEAYLELASEPIVTYREIGGKGVVEEAPGVPKGVTEQYMKLLDDITVCYLRTEWMRDGQAV